MFIITFVLFMFSLACSCSAIYTDTGSSESNRAKGEPPALSLGIIVFPGYQPLDVWGPLDMFHGMSQRRNLTLSIIAHKVGLVSTRTPPSAAYPDTLPKALEAHVMATHNFSNAPPLDILLVPGGSGNGVLERNNDTAIADFIATRYDELKYLLSVCTGAKHLAISGVLEGRRATTNKASWDIVVKHGRNVSWVPTARWTQDGKIWTSSGVAAGMDMTFAFLKHLFGEEQAGSVMNGMEYAPHTDPDWDPFSIVWKVPGADQGGSLIDCVKPVGY